ncbi:MAG: hypothetical protein OEY89_03385 [Gammaproteobacteria bacterium]|nr:hypothetical protein [Gammaproteobacteria bacterium]
MNTSQESNQKLVDRVKQDNERMTSLLEKYKETVTTLRASKFDNVLLANAVKKRDQWIGVCREKNNKMYSVNVELLQRYRQKGIGDMLAEKESFTGVATVELENQEQEYHFRLEDLQIPLFKPDMN